VKSHGLLLRSVVCIVLAVVSHAVAQVGYVNTPFAPGDRLFVNPLQNSPNTLSNLFGGNVPNGTTVSLWNATTLSFDPASTYSAGVWSLNLTLNPGTGALLNTPSVFTNTFVGAVLNHDGSLLNLNPLTPPPLYAGPNGLFLLGDKAPVGASGTDIFVNIFGRLPTAGEQMITLSQVSTYLGGGSWDITPTLNVGEAAFFNIGPIDASGIAVPEPTSLGLALLGCALLRMVSGRRRS